MRNVHSTVRNPTYIRRRRDSFLSKQVLLTRGKEDIAWRQVKLEIATQVLPVSGLGYAISDHLEHRLPEGLANGAKEGASPSLGISKERFVEETCLKHILEC